MFANSNNIKIGRVIVKRNGILTSVITSMYNISRHTGLPGLASLSRGTICNTWPSVAVWLMGSTQPYNFSPNLSRNFKFSPVFIWFKEATLLEAHETGSTILQAQVKKSYLKHSQNFKAFI